MLTGRWPPPLPYTERVMVYTILLRSACSSCWLVTRNSLRRGYRRAVVETGYLLPVVFFLRCYWPCVCCALPALLPSLFSACYMQTYT